MDQVPVHGTTARRSGRALAALLSLGVLWTAHGCANGDSAASSFVARADTALNLVGADFVAPTRAHIGESVGLGVVVGQVSLEAVEWRQLSGPPVVFHADRSKMIGFDVPASGTYVFEATLSALNGVRLIRVLSFSVDEWPVRVNARLDRAVRSGEKTSLRVTHSLRGEVSIRWRQSSGPAATIIGTEEPRLLVTAPKVTEDTLLRFEVTVSNDRGESADDELLLLVQQRETTLGPIYVYRPMSPHAEALETCVLPDDPQPCTLAQLPVLAQTTITPTVGDVMDRVAVSHNWMGRRFEEYLTQASAGSDVRRLLRAVTAIVIGADIRPSYYDLETGAIYIDAARLWITPEERDTISEQPDFRSAFGQELRFVMPTRYVIGDDYATRYYDPARRFTRLRADMHVELSSLLFHELAHANDFVPPDAWSRLLDSDLVWSVVDRGTNVSREFSRLFPLDSTEMYGLAEVQYLGRTATPIERSYFPEEVTGFFEPDRATDFYSYSARTQVEDVAQLFCALMMRHHFVIDVDVAITNRPRGAGVTGADYIVRWGQRGRIGEAKFAPCLRYVTKALLPELDVDEALANLPKPRLMRSDVDWVSNLSLGPEATALSIAAFQERAARPVRLLPEGH